VKGLDEAAFRDKYEGPVVFITFSNLDANKSKDDGFAAQTEARRLRRVAKKMLIAELIDIGADQGVSVDRNDVARAVGSLLKGTPKTSNVDARSEARRLREMVKEKLIAKLVKIGSQQGVSVDRNDVAEAVGSLVEDTPLASDDELAAQIAAGRLSQIVRGKLIAKLVEIGSEQDVSVNRDGVAEAVRSLVKGLHAKTGKGVTVLVDEYDKLVTDVLAKNGGQEDVVAEAMVEVMREFHQEIKDMSDFLRAEVVTGVTKFGRVSMFSGANNLDDTSFDPEFATVHGYSWEEIETAYDEHLTYIADRRYEESESPESPESPEARKEVLEARRKQLKAELTSMCGGWNRVGDDDALVALFCPVDINENLNKLVRKPKEKLKALWKTLGEPGWIAKYVSHETLHTLGLMVGATKHRVELWVTEDQLETIQVSDLSKQSNVSATGKYTMDAPVLLHLLLQAGYVSVVDMRETDDGEREFQLAPPNKSVHKSLAREVAKVRGNARSSLQTKLHDEDLQGYLEEVLGNMSYLFTGVTVGFRELSVSDYLLNGLLVDCMALGFKTPGREVATKKGSLDLLFPMNSAVVGMEVKLMKASGTSKAKEATLDKAKAQMDDPVRDYLGTIEERAEGSRPAKRALAVAVVLDKTPELVRMSTKERLNGGDWGEWKSIL